MIRVANGKINDMLTKIWGEVKHGSHAAKSRRYTRFGYCVFDVCINGSSGRSSHFVHSLKGR
jgi:hypothetical protein